MLKVISSNSDLNINPDFVNVEEVNIAQRPRNFTWSCGHGQKAIEAFCVTMSHYFKINMDTFKQITFP